MTSAELPLLTSERARAGPKNTNLSWAKWLPKPGPTRVSGRMAGAWSADDLLPPGSADPPKWVLLRLSVLPSTIYKLIFCIMYCGHRCLEYDGSNETYCC